MKALCWQGKHKISCETGVIGADDRAQVQAGLILDGHER